MKLERVNVVAELNVDKIIVELNKLFEKNRLVFWYDSNAEFTESLSEIEKQINASVCYLHNNEQFKTKLFLEENKEENYLVYAPFVKPAIEQDFLTDIESYSASFTADAQVIMLQDLGLPTNQLQFVKEHFKFFGSQERVKIFKKYRDQRVDKKPELGIIATILRVERLQLNEVLLKVFSAGLENNKYLTEFEKYGVSDFFWDMMNAEFGYVNEKRDLKHLVMSLYLNYIYATMESDLPKELENYGMGQINNVVAFMSAFEDSYQSNELFETYATMVWNDINLQKYLQNVSEDDLLKISFLDGVDQMIIVSLIKEIQQVDLKQNIKSSELIELCDQRIIHSKYRENEYRLLKAAFKILGTNFMPYLSFEDAVERYEKNDYWIDTEYRHFVLLYSEIGNIDKYKEVKELVEKIYINNNLNRSIQSWNDVFTYDQIPSQDKQLNFYKNYVGPQEHRIVVIISDAFRFELAKELQAKLDTSDRIKTSMGHLFTNLPSVTYMGMPSLLPHQSVELSDEANQLMVDGQAADTRVKREKIIQARHLESAAYQLDDLLKLTSTELKRKFAGQKIVYVYHNQVDAVGDNAKNENEVFKAGQDAIDEIDKLVESLRTISVSHVIVTSDHGFIYRDDQLSESDKINLNNTQEINKSLRYAITAEDIDEMGIAKISLSEELGNDDPRFVYYPKSANVFKANGSNNYVHGGSSLQEMLVPVLDIKTSSNKSQAEYVELKLGNSNKRVTGLTVPLPFIQTAPVSDKVLPAEYKIYFVDEDDHLISNQENINANSSKQDIGSQQLRARLTIRNQNYDKNKIYRLVIENTNSGEKIFENFTFDLTISNDFGFDF